MNSLLKETSHWTMTTKAGAYATEPDLLRDKTGTCWLAWTERAPAAAGGHEGVIVACLEAPALSDWPTTPSPCFNFQSTAKDCCWPTFAKGDNVSSPTLFWVAWQSAHLRRATLMMAKPGETASTQKGGGTALREAPGLMHPAATVDDAGQTWVVYICEQHNSFDVEVLKLGRRGDVLRHLVIASGRSLKQRPAVVLTEGRALVAWECYDAGEISVEATLLSETMAPLWKRTWGAPACFNQAPALGCSEAGELWAAWNTDWRPDRAPDLARRVVLGKIDAATGELRRLYDVPGVDLEAQGEDQSLEFPALSVDDEGIWLSARASHNTRVLRLEGDRWTQALDLGEVLWGCRGTRVQVTGGGVHRALVSCHDRRGITVREVSRVALDVEDEAKATGEAPLLSELSEVRSLPKADSAHRASWGGLGAFWGDIHFHSAHSDGVGTIGEAYLRCRDRYGFDFASLTEHDGFIGRRVTTTVWRKMVTIAEHFNASPAFTTLIGIEYTGPRYPGPGHKCLYFDDPTAPLVCRRDGLEAPEKLLARVAELGGIAIPHHVGWLGGDPDHHDETVQPCWEVCSTHGQYEAPTDDADAPAIGYREGLEADQEALRGHFIRRRLEAGQVFGFVGGSDGHGLLWHHGISRRRDSHRTGLTGVWLTTLGRAEVMAAIRARRTWCTSGAKMALGYRVDGAVMGTVFQKGPPSGAISVHLSATGTAPLSELVVFASTTAGTRVVYRSQDAIGRTQIEEEVTLDAALVKGAGQFLYVRATQEDGEVAWASPVFWRGA